MLPRAALRGLPEEDLDVLEAVAGKPPFDGKTPLAVLREVADTPHRPLRKLTPDVPEWFEDVVDGLLAKDPDERFQSAAEALAGIEWVERSAAPRQDSATPT